VEEVVIDPVEVFVGIVAVLVEECEAEKARVFVSVHEVVGVVDVDLEIAPAADAVGVEGG